MRRSARFIVRALALSFILVAAGGTVTAQTTEFGTQRHETIIVQTFDARSPAPDTFNYYLAGQDRWHGARELAFAYLWETDTGTGATVWVTCWYITLPSFFRLSSCSWLRSGYWMRLKRLPFSRNAYRC